MFTKFLFLALAASPLVTAHGKVAVVTGDQGGNTTALAIKGGVVPGPGRNSVTEVDTTVFRSTDIQSDGLGRTTGAGANKVSMLGQAMALSGSTLPQVAADGTGSVSGVFHVVTTDGAGPIQAVLDPTGTGAFSEGVLLNTTTQIPGKKGNIRVTKELKQQQQEQQQQQQQTGTKRSLVERAADVLESFGIVKRASNVNMDFPMAFSVPAGTTCSGTVEGIENVCLVKIANSNRAGPFGGIVAVQMVSGVGQVGGNDTAEVPAAAARREVKFSA